MYTLSDQQIDFILNDIKIRGVEMEDLQLNLLDHICCIIECELEQEGDFEDFYHKTIPKFFKKELKEIEEETKLLLTFKNYYAMKKTMNAVGIIASISIVLGAIFKFQHWAGANIMMISGVILITLVFLPLMFTLKLRESTEKRDRTILILGGTIVILIVIALSFKLMHWPGGNSLLGISILSLLLLYVPIYLFTGLRNPVTKTNTLINAILIIAGSGLLMSLSTKDSGAGFYGFDNLRGIHERLDKSTDITVQHNAFIYNSLNTDSIPADVKNYFSKCAETEKYLEDLKIGLIAYSEKISDAEAKKLNWENINGNGSPNIVMEYMTPERTEELKAKLTSLNTQLKNLKGAEENKWSMHFLINHENFDNKSYFKDNFDHMQLGYVLQKFDELKYEIVNTNSQVLNYYSAKL